MTANNLSHLCPHLQLDPPEVVELDGYEYGDGKVTISLKTGAGGLVAYVMSTAAFLQSISLATAFVNENLNDILADICVFTK